MLLLSGAGSDWWVSRKNSSQKFDGTFKTVLEFKASLIAAKLVEKEDSSEAFSARFIKNIQPISVGV